MKKMMLILLVGCVFNGCKEPLELTKKNLIGNWWYFDDGGGYNELHINAKEMVWITDAGMYINYTYVINNDSVTTYLYNGGDLNGTMKIEMLNTNRFEQSWIDPHSNREVKFRVQRIEYNIMSVFDYFDQCIKGDKEGNKKKEYLFYDGFFERVKKD